MSTTLGRLPLLFWLCTSGCAAGIPVGAGTGGYYHDGGPHPYVSAVAVIRAGPLEAMTRALTQTRPVTDLVQLTANWGPELGMLRPEVGLGWSWWRTWGTCNENGRWCDHAVRSDLVVNTGLVLTIRPLRVDLRYSLYGAEAPFSGAPWLTAGFEIGLGGEKD